MIKELFEKLCCKHKWYKHQRVHILERGYENPTGYEDTLICKKCGKIKKVKL